MTEETRRADPLIAAAINAFIIHKDGFKLFSLLLAYKYSFPLTNIQSNLHISKFSFVEMEIFMVLSSLTSSLDS